MSMTTPASNEKLMLLCAAKQEVVSLLADKTISVETMTVMETPTIAIMTTMPTMSTANIMMMLTIMTMKTLYNG